MRMELCEKYVDKNMNGCVIFARSVNDSMISFESTMDNGLFIVFTGCLPSQGIQGKVREFCFSSKSQGKVREFRKKVREKSGNVFESSKF